MERVDVDDTATWPVDIRRTALKHAELLKGTTRWTSDLDISPEDERSFRRQMEGRRVLSYHATRLLDHEIKDIRHSGLRPSSPQLVASRIEQAHKSGHLSEAEVDELTRHNLYSREYQVNIREAKVCLFLSRGVMTQSVSGIWRLLTTWGGEVIYFHRRFTEETLNRLRLLGQPALVVAAVDIAADGSREHLVFPGLLRSFVARQLGFEDFTSEIHYYRPIAGDDVVDVWTPGHSDYANHPDLPPGIHSP